MKAGGSMNGLETLSQTDLALLWLVAAVALFIIEALTVQMICIWFAFGALLAMIAALLGAPLYIQMPVFLVASVSVLFAWRPLLKKKLTPKQTATNADMVIGQTGIVTEAIDNIAQNGRVLANGLSWAARSGSGREVPEGERVTVVAIDGVKLIVELIENMEEETV